jgi:CMP/dCMP kinase
MSRLLIYRRLSIRFLCLSAVLTTARPLPCHTDSFHPKPRRLPALKRFKIVMLRKETSIKATGAITGQKTVVIAIDGPAGAGKSTIARSLARRLGFTYIDTGAMYRAVALWALRANIDLDDLHRLEQLAREARIEFDGDAVRLNDEDVTAAIREPAVSDAASKVSIAPGVRRAMREEQRRIGSQSSVVMEGRDIGTVVFPEARVKVYLDADPEVRAGRRAKETGAAVDHVAREIDERDRRDRSRTEAPLMQAPDAEYLDTSKLTQPEVEEAILKIIRRRISN